MLYVLLNLLPIFALIALGVALGRLRFLPAEGWVAVERLTYWVLFPALLFESIVGAELRGGEAGRLAIAFALVSLAMATGLLALRRRLPLTGAEFSSLFQVALRWNGYVGLGVAGALYGEAGVALAAVGMAVLVPINNVLSVYVLSRFAGATPASPAATARAVATNPLILATVGGGVFAVAGLEPPAPVLSLLELLGAATIPLGLLCVGAALDLQGLGRSARVLASGAGLKLAASPMLGWLACRAMGLDGRTLEVALICLGAPAATSAYILARQLGGDAPLAARLVTVTTIGSLLTLPLVVLLVG